MTPDENASLWLMLPIWFNVAAIRFHTQTT